MRQVTPDDELVNEELDAELAETPWREARTPSPSSGWEPPAVGRGSAPEVIRG